MEQENLSELSFEDDDDEMGEDDEEAEGEGEAVPPKKKAKV